MYAQQLFSRYFAEWIETYKRGAVTQITLNKYLMTLKQIKLLIPNTKVADLNRIVYQNLLNTYARTHERQTVLDFHHQLKAVLSDAIEDGLLRKDPTRKAVIKGKAKQIEKVKFLNQAELKKLLNMLCLDHDHLLDYTILITAKTGLRFAEVLGLTVQDINFKQLVIDVNKTWNYKTKAGGFAPTKNDSSRRKIHIDWQLALQLKEFIDTSDHCEQSDSLLFIQGKRIHNSTVNSRLESLCIEAGIPVITFHGLRHTHASLLLYKGVSIASVAKRLGHANMATTQSTYLHIIQELETQDDSKIMQFLGSL